MTIPESVLYTGNLEFIEGLYQRFLKNPNDLSTDWQNFFKTQSDFFQNTEKTQLKPAALPLDDGSVPFPVPPKPTAPKNLPSQQTLPKNSETDSFFQILSLINGYRGYGHLAAKLNPLVSTSIVEKPRELLPETYGLQDLSLSLDLKGHLGFYQTTLNEVITKLASVYCQSIAFEYMHLHSIEEREWLQQHIETQSKITPQSQQDLLESLTRSETFEHFLHIKYPGAKRFGLDGCESLIPALEELVSQAYHSGTQEIIIGMAHRGRLNVLHNILGKPIAAILQEFEGKPSFENVYGSGDVKYHLGFSADKPLDQGSIHLSLVANPSHLEAVNPVVLGKVRAKQQYLQDHKHEKVLGVLIHGDAAFAGQGVVAETLMLSQLSGYRTGGTVHIIINNQIGFTTNPEYSRSSFYCSAPAYTIQAPIFHVNGDDPESVLAVIQVAMAFRHRFKRDVVIDIVCYRRYGHNESDEPAFTQPKMYRTIATQPTARALYAKFLGVSEEAANALVQHVEQPLKQAFEQKASYTASTPLWRTQQWATIIPTADDTIINLPVTGVTEMLLQQVGQVLSTVQPGFSLNPKIERQLAAKKQMFESQHNIDWATAEALAFGTLLQEGKRLRLSGQDSGRGTFSQRHIVLTDQNTEERYLPLSKLEPSGFLEVVDSPLAEMSVLGFEYGYSVTDPNTLVLWEGQFGDFANGAQVIIDQFISAGEMKWLRMSGLVLLLPHGFEGMGPEHSSARLERYLQLCGNNNMQVANCTTPANYFHILRRQLHQPSRKPLILMTPKSLLRHKLAVSSLADMIEPTTFQPVLSETQSIGPKESIRRLIFCSGKIYYDLYQEREALKRVDCALVRLEQFYPFPKDHIAEQLALYSNAQIVWCQEEPKNMGAWTFIAPLFEQLLTKKQRLTYIGRPAAASPATGYAPQHTLEQASILKDALL